jgi:hypothetical protein
MGLVDGEMRWAKRGKNTCNRRDSQMVTHSSTSRPVQCLCMAERTGCPVFTDLWSYVSGLLCNLLYALNYDQTDSKQLRIRPIPCVLAPRW